MGLAFLTGIVALLYRRLAVAPGWPVRVRRSVLGVLVAGTLVFVAAAALLRRGDPAPVRPVVWLGMTELAVALYLGLGLAVLAVVAGGLRLTGRGEARLRWLRLGTPTVVVIALVVTGYGVVAALRPGVARHTVTSAALPAGFDGARAVLLTDLHVGALHDASWTRRVVDIVNEQHPDLVLLGGDLVDGNPRRIARYLDPLADLDTPLGVYAVTGNHEFVRGAREAEQWVEVWRSLGIRPLLNEHVEVRRGADHVVLAGVNDAQGLGALRPDPDAALAGIDADDFTIFLTHEPRQVVADAGVDLQLSGHTHGGQLWPVHLLVRLLEPAVSGFHVVDGVPMIISRGVGTSGPPVRVLAPSQIDVVTLRRG